MLFNVIFSHVYTWINVGKKSPLENKWPFFFFVRQIWVLIALNLKHNWLWVVVEKWIAPLQKIQFEFKRWRFLKILKYIFFLQEKWGWHLTMGENLKYEVKLNNRKIFFVNKIMYRTPQFKRNFKLIKLTQKLCVICLKNNLILWSL